MCLFRKRCTKSKSNITLSFLQFVNCDTLKLQEIIVHKDPRNNCTESIRYVSVPRYGDRLMVRNCCERKSTKNTQYLRYCWGFK